MLTNQQVAEYAAKANASGKILRRDSDGSIILDENGEPFFDEYIITQEEIIASNESIIDALSDEAEKEIELLKRAIKHKMTTNGEVEKLDEWEMYTVLLSRVDTSVKEMILPEKPAD